MPVRKKEKKRRKKKSEGRRGRLLCYLYNVYLSPSNTQRK